jgi:NAD(P)H-hydrate repair Nnr-like enzyme with NAD(P)H-hydrate dehydratase domain
MTLVLDAGALIAIDKRELMAESGQRILTSDPDDVAHLLSVRGIDAIIIEV